MTHIMRVDEMFNKQTIDPQDFVIVDAWDATYDELIEDYADALTSTDYGNFFILPKTEIQYLEKSGNCSVYEIPTFCKTLDDAEDGLLNGTLDPQEENSPLVKLF